MTIETSEKRQLVDITDQVADEVQGRGVVQVFVRHTTAAITTADLDPGTDQDILDALTAMTPAKDWQHPHDPGHFPDHLWATIIGPDVSIPYLNGQLQLGQWQRIILVELDGPRERQLTLTYLQAAPNG